MKSTFARATLALVGFAGVHGAFAQTSKAPPSSTTKMAAEIVLLGTAGGPPAHLDRSQPASLLRIAGKSYLIDAGENVAQQLERSGGTPQSLTAVFLSHLHWDHTLGLDYLMATGWMRNRATALPIYGPPGTSDFVNRTVSAVGVGEDIFRAQSPERPPLGSLYPANEISADGPVEIYRDDTVRVTAVRNSHFAVLHSAPHSYGEDKSYAFRFDTKDGCVVFTGDTGPSKPLERLAQGCGTLVSEVVDLDSIRRALEMAQGAGKIDALLLHMQQQHLSPEEVGKLAQASGVKRVVLTHYVVGADFDAAKLVPKIRATFLTGDIVLGKDLSVIPLGDK